MMPETGNTRLKLLLLVGAIVVLAAMVVVLTPLVAFPKVVKRSIDPTGRYLAEVVVKPYRNGPLAHFFAAIDGKSVNIYARIRSTDSQSPATEEELLTECEESEKDGEAVQIQW